MLPLTRAVSRQCWSHIEGLLREGVSEYDLNEALRQAAAGGNVRIVERLLQAGADIHVLNDSPLRLASSCGHVPTC